MKRLFILTALFVTAVFAGCNNTNGIKGGTPYSGDLLGSWQCNQDLSTKLTFYDNGSFTEIKTKDNAWVSESYGLFYVQEGIVALTYKKHKDSKGEILETQIYTECSYIVNTSQKEIVLQQFEYNPGKADLEYAKSIIENDYNGHIDSGITYFKQ